MPNNREISAALKRLSKGKPDPDDLDILRSALSEGKISVGNDVNQSIIVDGDGNQITLNISHEAFRQLQSTSLPSPTQPGDLPPGSYLPFPRNAIFTGRVADLEKLYENLLLPSPLGRVPDRVEGPG